MNTTHTLTNFAQRGSLTYMTGNYEFKTVQGWFYLSGNTVVMRKIRGRNEYRFCSEELVHEFTPYDKEFETFYKEMNEILKRTKAQ